jgi:metal-responsive CopG/Arc/MetJ family transcriptional regulator
MPKIKIELDSDMFDKLKQLAQDAGYSSSEEFVQHLIEKEIASLDSAGSEEELKRRLQGLGYIS